MNKITTLKTTLSAALSITTIAMSPQLHAEVLSSCITGENGEWICSAWDGSPIPIKPTATTEEAAVVEYVEEKSQPVVEVAVESKSESESESTNEPTVKIEIDVDVDSIAPPKPIIAKSTLPTSEVNSNKLCATTDKKSGPTPAVNNEEEPLSINADEMELHNKNLLRYSGSVLMSRGDQTLRTDRATYNHEVGVFEADGNLIYQDSATEMRGDSGLFNSQTDQGAIYNAEYKIYANHSSGSAERIDKLSPYINKYSNTTYTTCDPENKSWELEADEVVLDDLEGWGSAKNAVVRFKGVPIIYTPSYTFPLDERRKSGALSPSWGYEKTGGGLISAPYYWNIAPNRDATITPRLIAKRGLLLDGNYRYMEQNSEGEFDAGFLPSDDLYQDDRWQVKLAHKGDYRYSELDNALTYEVNYASLSDRNYFSDLGNTLGLASSDTLEQTAKVSYNEDQWSASILFSDHYSVGKRGKCTISGTENSSYTTERSCTTNSGEWSVVDITGDNEPYRKLPQIDAAWASESNDNQLNYNISSQFTHFDHDTKITGNRLSVTPSVNYRYTFLDDSAYLTPSVSILHSRYNLNSSANKSPQRTIPTYKVESGLFFERDVTYDLFGFGGDYLQELTPSLTYTYIPDGRDSDLTSELTDFDSTTVSAEESELLKTTFVGSDKATNTKQLSAKLSTTFTNLDNSEKTLTASIEQAINFISNEKTASNIIGKLASDSGAHHSDLNLSLDPYDGQNDLITANYQYNPSTDYIFNIGHSYSRDSKEQYDLSAAWKIGSYLGGTWNIFGRYNYSLFDPNSHTLEELNGITYDTCCWALRFTRNRYFDGTETLNGATRNNFNTKWFLTLELKGLGNLGKRGPLNELLTDSIKGYKAE